MGDLRAAARRLGRSPLATLAMAATLALGASPAGLAWATVGDGLRLVGIGLALGVPAAFAADRLLVYLVPDLVTGGPATVAAAAALFALVSLLAAGLPARRASRPDPAVALRAE